MTREEKHRFDDSTLTINAVIGVNAFACHGCVAERESRVSTRALALPAHPSACAPHARFRAISLPVLWSWVDHKTDGPSNGDTFLDFIHFVAEYLPRGSTLVMVCAGGAAGHAHAAQAGASCHAHACTHTHLHLAPCVCRTTAASTATTPATWRSTY